MKENEGEEGVRGCASWALGLDRKLVILGRLKAAKCLTMGVKNLSPGTAWGWKPYGHFLLGFGRRT